MTPEQLFLLTVAIFIVALFYSCVGHAGASGYIAVMSLFGVTPAVIKPTALLLNILVACIGAWQYSKAGQFSWRLFWPFALLAIPMSFLGGYINLTARAFKVIVGIILLISATGFLFHQAEDSVVEEPSRRVAIPVGAGLGLLSGLTGTGGGIFLTPLLLFGRWARAKQAAAVSAVFILVNSAAGLLGNLSSTKRFPSFAIVLAVAAISGGAVGSYLGSRHFEHTTIKRLVAIVLLIAGLKLILTR